jgi:archaellum component FlaC
MKKQTDGARYHQQSNELARLKVQENNAKLKARQLEREMNRTAEKIDRLKSQIKNR